MPPSDRPLLRRAAVDGRGGGGRTPSGFGHPAVPDAAWLLRDPLWSGPARHPPTHTCRTYPRWTCSLPYSPSSAPTNTISVPARTTWPRCRATRSSACSSHSSSGPSAPRLIGAAGPPGDAAIRHDLGRGGRSPPPVPAATRPAHWGPGRAARCRRSHSRPGRPTPGRPRRPRGHRAPGVRRPAASAGSRWLPLSRFGSDNQPVRRFDGGMALSRLQCGDWWPSPRQRLNARVGSGQNAGSHLTGGGQFYLRGPDAWTTVATSNSSRPGA